MDRELRLKFSKALSSMEGKNYIHSIIAYNAAATIEGFKPSSLMTFTSRGKDAAALWKLYGQGVCTDFSLDYFELKNEDDQIIVLFYRKKMLERHMSKKSNQPFMQRMGYGTAVDLEQKLQKLKQRFETLCPHEIGIFLGIPVEDVEGFISHKGKNCLICRYWKVYGDIKRAEVLFKIYDKARINMAEFLINLKTNILAEQA
ncbi:hypothetical protein OXPF_33710 [Oxobacter pfennigii]|uniref:DUF3793 family protein n=1 Tax=Oxobacter pfennigii TaxID=36849 RepID=A0A0P8W5D0_9CLOT|nr:DUF3793 family protein [Oxobacter pfennigii]KPU43121.1 hypothetical protein OXPF_33710 [Oxobacter pfennigii]